jgi:coenzyme F420-reducing hydrogenase delta subunit
MQIIKFKIIHSCIMLSLLVSGCGDKRECNIGMMKSSNSIPVLFLIDDVRYSMHVASVCSGHVNDVYCVDRLRNGFDSSNIVRLGDKVESYLADVSSVMKSYMSSADFTTKEFSGMVRGRLRVVKFSFDEKVKNAWEVYKGAIISGGGMAVYMRDDIVNVGMTNNTSNGEDDFVSVAFIYFDAAAISSTNDTIGPVVILFSIKTIASPDDVSDVLINVCCVGRLNAHISP